MVDKDSLMVHNKLTNAVVPRSRSGKTPRALQFPINLGARSPYSRRERQSPN